MARKHQEVQKSGNNTKKKDTPIPSKKKKPAVEKTKAGDKSMELDESKKGPLKSLPNYATVSNTRIEKGSSKMKKKVPIGQKRITLGFQN